MCFRFTLGVSSLWVLFDITLHSVALVLHGVGGSASSYFYLSPWWARFRISTTGKARSLGFVGQGDKKPISPKVGFFVCVFFYLEPAGVNVDCCACSLCHDPQVRKFATAEPHHAAAWSVYITAVFAVALLPIFYKVLFFPHPIRGTECSVNKITGCNACILSWTVTGISTHKGVN